MLFTQKIQVKDDDKLGSCFTDKCNQHLAVDLLDQAPHLYFSVVLQVLFGLADVADSQVI